MTKNKKIKYGDKLASTSSFTVDDIVDYVADSLPTGKCRVNIEQIVRDTVGADAQNYGCTPFNPNKRYPGSGKHSHINVPEFDVSGKVGSKDIATYSALINKDGNTLFRAVGGRTDLCAGSKSDWFNVVLQNGEVWSPYTSRRFLPAQYLRLMLDEDGNVDAAIAIRYSMKDVFRILDNEIEKLIFLEKYERVAFLERSKFLSEDDCRRIIAQYLTGLKDNINNRDKCTYKKRSGKYVRRIQGIGTITLWTYSKCDKDGEDGSYMCTESIVPTRWLSDMNMKIDTASSKLYKCHDYASILTLLRTVVPHISMGTYKDSEGRTRNWIPATWKECFKKQGAYYTLKNLIVGGHVKYSESHAITYSGRGNQTVTADTARDGLNSLKLLSERSVPAYIVHAILKKSIEVSRFDVRTFLTRVSHH